MTRIVAIVIFTVSLSLASTPSVRATGNASIPSAVRRNIQDRVDNGMSVGIIVGVVDSGGTSYYSYGAPQKEGDRKLDENTIFEIGSITKTFTSALLTDLVERGAVQLTDPIAKYLPDHVKVPTRSGKSITLEHLANHTSGLPRLPSNFDVQAVDNPYAAYTADQLYEFLTEYRLPRDAGSAYEHSNLGSGLLGHLLSRAAGKPYERLVVERIAAPLGMEDTRITLSTQQRHRLAQGHEGEEPTGPWDFDCLAGCGALRSSAKDLLRFLAANLGLVETELYPALRHAQSGRRDTERPGLKAALSWYVWAIPDAEIIWHSGGTGGFHSFCGFDPNRKLGVVVLSNSTDKIDDIGLHLLEPRFALKPVRKAVAISAGVLDRYTGYYEVGRGRIFHVTRVGDQLYIQLTGQGKYPIYAESETKFFYKVVDAAITFEKGNEGKVTGLILHQGGVDRTARKLGPEYRPLPPRVEVPVAPDILKRYVGQYELAPGAVAKVTLEDGKLMVQLPGQPRYQVFPESDESFFYKGVDAQIMFRQDQDGDYVHLILNRGGIGTYAKRVKGAPEATENGAGQIEKTPPGKDDSP